jgi:hypothetical protein
LLLIAAVTASCGSAKTVSTTTAAQPPDPAAAVQGSTTLYQGGEWAVVVKGDSAVALHFVGGEWKPDRTGAVKVTFLGPRGTVAPISQVAATLSAGSPLVESALWVDGQELLEKGGGLTPKRGTIYGTTAAPLRRGTHTAVAYGRTATHAHAVAWTFRV